MISYFRLQGYPFMKNIPVTKLRLSGSQMEGLMMMERVLVSKEIGLLIGESGTGKSLILESLAKNFHKTCIESYTCRTLRAVPATSGAI